MEEQKIAVLIPCYNEELTIEKVIKLTNFSNALTSIILTQIVLLDTYANMEVYNSNLMNGLTGMGIGTIIILLGLHMIIGINMSKIRKVY